MITVALLALRMRRLLIPILLMLGLGLRSYHYLRDRAVWHDEAGLLLSVDARDFHDLFLGRLDYHENGPPLYLWTLKTVGLLFGDSSYALRLPSFLASCAALLLFALVARRMLTPGSAAWAVLWFAVSEQLLWHASEAKPYSVDVLAATVVLAVPCFRQLGSLRRQLLAYTLLIPLLLLSSYPASFLGGGLLLAFLPVVFRSREGTTWLTYGALAATTATIVLWLVLVPGRRQHDAELHSCWVNFMPNWQRPATVPGWFLLAPFEVCRYCCKPLGQILALFVVPGTLILWRVGEYTKVRLMLAPIFLALAAACVHAYPFGGARIMVYAAPAILLLAAAGVPPVLTWLSMRSRLACALPVGLLLLPVASSLELVVHHWTEADIPAAAYVQSRRQTDDLIVGNDVTQQYYFRREGPAFHLLDDDSPLPSPKGERLWVVITAAVPQGERERLASHFAPPDWLPRRQREFAFTTVILFSR